MSLKAFVLSIVILLSGVFVFLKLELGGSPASRFNQTTRFQWGRYPFLRTVLGLHNAGDARAEYLSGSGPILIEWFTPPAEELDPSVLDKFANLVGRYTGRQTQLVAGGDIGYTTLRLDNSSSLGLRAAAQKPKGGSVFLAVFAEDYEPRSAKELSTTYGESGLVLSLDAHRQFLQALPQYLNQYLLSSLLHEFGHQIGLPHSSDSSCIMDLHAGMQNQPLETLGQFTPQDYCAQEQAEITNIKGQLQN